MHENPRTPNTLLLEELNPAQRQAVEHSEGPLLVLAGAGAGKTKVVTYRIANLIAHGVSPSEILAVTFTNKAAGEMRNRILGLLGGGRDAFDAAPMPFMATFHSLGVHILRAEYERAGIPRQFSILDRGDSLKLVKEAMKRRGIGEEWKPERLLGAISRRKGDGGNIDEAGMDASSWSEEAVAHVWQEYEALLRAEGALDFDDLLVRPMRLLQEHADIRDRYRKRWRFVHIDEYQDTNRAQYELGKLLVGGEENICVVGDADQTIYTWRGANINNILNFERDYPRALVVRLEQNYRSTKTILAAANTVIAKNTLRKEKTLFTDNGDGEKIKTLFCADENDEGRTVAESIQALIDSGIDPREIAVLYRANFQSRALEQALLAKRIPYQLLGVRFFERKEVKDILSYIRFALNPECTSDLARVINEPKRGIGKTTLDRVRSGKLEELSPALRRKVEDFFSLIAKIGEAARTIPPSKLVPFVLKETGIEKMLAEGDDDDKERLANAQELASLALKYDNLPNPEGVLKFLEDAALASDADSLSHDTKAVRLMTIHASKGLEFDHVFITGLEQGLFPQEKERATREEQEEERRLFYVALTRARKRLYLSLASIRTIFGSRSFTTPSEFLSDIDPELLEETVELVERPTHYLDIEW